MAHTPGCWGARGGREGKCLLQQGGVYWARRPFHGGKGATRGSRKQITCFFPRVECVLCCHFRAECVLVTIVWGGNGQRVAHSEATAGSLRGGNKKHPLQNQCLHLSYSPRMRTSCIFVHVFVYVFIVVHTSQAHLLQKCRAFYICQGGRWEGEEA